METGCPGAQSKAPIWPGQEQQGRSSGVSQGQPGPAGGEEGMEHMGLVPGGKR